jgi:hypothetical protein
MSQLRFKTFGSFARTCNTVGLVGEGRNVKSSNLGVRRGEFHSSRW